MFAKKHRKIIGVLNFGGQYAHLISSRIRGLGAFSEVLNPDDLNIHKASSSYGGLILSGGPASVYESGSPSLDPKLMDAGIPLLGLCYGHQLLVHLGGGKISSSIKGEYGPSRLILCSDEGASKDIPEDIFSSLKVPAFI